MSDTGYYPPEYGIDVGEVCGRNRCAGRMVYERSPHVCMPGEMCECGAEDIVYCGVCGEGSEND